MTKCFQIQTAQTPYHRLTNQTAHICGYIIYFPQLASVDSLVSHSVLLVPKRPKT